MQLDLTLNLPMACTAIIAVLRSHHAIGPKVSAYDVALEAAKAVTALSSRNHINRMCFRARGAMEALQAIVDGTEISEATRESARAAAEVSYFGIILHHVFAILTLFSNLLHVQFDSSPL